mmetsp:Transcript_8192/g.12822  ORF Transcript_8192/g.12822 Transcript_8192/m.12822 type:complete len:239 (+) Transcript_8192:1785-2501(+)
MYAAISSSLLFCCGCFFVSVMAFFAGAGGFSTVSATFCSLTAVVAIAGFSVSSLFCKFNFCTSSPSFSTRTISTGTFFVTNNAAAGFFSSCSPPDCFSNDEVCFSLPQTGPDANFLPASSPGVTPAAERSNASCAVFGEDDVDGAFDEEADPNGCNNPLPPLVFDLVDSNNSPLLLEDDPRNRDCDPPLVVITGTGGAAGVFDNTLLRFLPNFLRPLPAVVPRFRLFELPRCELLLLL